MGNVKGEDKRNGKNSVTPSGSGTAVAVATAVHGRKSATVATTTKAKGLGRASRVCSSRSSDSTPAAAATTSTSTTTTTTPTTSECVWRRSVLSPRRWLASAAGGGVMVSCAAAATAAAAAAAEPSPPGARSSGGGGSSSSRSPSTSTGYSSFFSPIHQRLAEWEGRLRRWKLFSNRRQRRSASSDPKTGASVAKSARARPCDFLPGSLTCPVPRRTMQLSGRMRHLESMETDRPIVSDEEMNRRFAEIQARSGVIEIGPQRYEGIKIDNLTFKAELGSGASGCVTRRVLDNRFIAVKEMKRTDNEQETKRIFTDLQVICNSNDCPFIVRSYGYILTFDHVYICMEMMAMCLEKLYKTKLKPLDLFIPEPILGRITVSVVSALKYLKDVHHIIHRDVKPSNILIDWNGNIKLCDFGIAGQLIDSVASTTGMGCAAYLSPERLNRANYDVRADIWALGISLIELAMNQYPYPNVSSPFTLMITIQSEPAPKLPTTFSSEFRAFVDKCLEKDPAARPKYRDLVKLPFFEHSEHCNIDVGEWLSGTLGEEED